MSAEADVAFWDDPDEAKSDRVDGAIGEYSQFHQQFGCYGQGVSVATAVLPVGWRDRVVRFDRADAEPSTAMCTAEESVSTEEIAPGRPSMDLGTEFSPRRRRRWPVTTKVFIRAVNWTDSSYAQS